MSLRPLALGATLLAAAAATHAQTETPMQDEQTTIAPETVRGRVEDYFRATQSGDADAWAATFASGAVVEDPVGSEPLRDPKAIRAQGEAFVSAFVEVGLYESFIHVNGLEAAAMWTGRATTEDGQALSFEGIDLFEFDETGKITRLRGFWTPPGS